MDLRTSIRLVALSSVLATQACTYWPQDGDALLSDDSTQFIGFTTAPSLKVRIQAKWPVNGQWYQIAEVTSDPSPYPASYPTFKHNLYQWSHAFTVPSWAFSGNNATLRARQELGSDWVDTYMYDNAGWDCLVDRYFAAGPGPLDVRNAGIECSNDRHEITLHRP